MNSLSKSKFKSKRWQKLQTKEYRDAYAEAQLSIEIPFQIRALRKARGWTQAKLADLCSIPQARISHIEQPGREPLSLRTLYRLSSAFDVGLLVQFVSFSELVQREEAFHPEMFNVSSFKDDQLEEAVVPTVAQVRVTKAVVSTVAQIRVEGITEYFGYFYLPSRTAPSPRAWYQETTQTTSEEKEKRMGLSVAQLPKIEHLNTATRISKYVEICSSH